MKVIASKNQGKSKEEDPNFISPGSFYDWLKLFNISPCKNNKKDNNNNNNANRNAIEALIIISSFLDTSGRFGGKSLERTPNRAKINLLGAK